MFWNKNNQKKSMTKKKPLQKWTPTYVPPETKKQMVTEPVKKGTNNMHQELQNKNWEKEFLHVFNGLLNQHRALDVWRDFIVMYACAISNPLDKKHYEEREKRYMDIITKYGKEDQKIFPELAAIVTMALTDNPEQDFLGTIFMNLNLGNNLRGQFFTPYNVCRLMAELTIGAEIVTEIKKKGYISINDPCCGAGATLIAGVHAAQKYLEEAKIPMNYQNCVLVVAQDIDETVALMCYIQISLLGVAGYVKVGNSLTSPIVSGELTDNYWFTPMYYSNVWIKRRLRS